MGYFLKVLLLGRLVSLEIVYKPVSLSFEVKC